jgi:hypothetical protein
VQGHGGARKAHDAALSRLPEAASHSPVDGVVREAALSSLGPRDEAVLPLGERTYRLVPVHRYIRAMGYDNLWAVLEVRNENRAEYG